MALVVNGDGNITGLSVGGLPNGVVNSSVLDSSLIPVGVSQVWQNVAGSRAKRTTYQNTTGRPIVVAVSFVAPFTSTMQLWTHSTSDVIASGVMILQADGGDYYTASAYTNHPANVTAIIPNNYYYQAYDPNNDATVSYWTELR